MEKLIIIGSGPAGLTAAIYSARAFLNPLVIVGPEPGGQLVYTTQVENFPGFPQGIFGPELIMAMRKQAERFGARFIESTINSANFSQKPYTITIDDQILEATCLIIASGARSKTLGLKDEIKYLAKGVHTCATCDGAFYRDKAVAIVGGGESAMVEAMFLTKFANQVLIINRSGQLSATAEMRNRIGNNNKIKIIYNSEVVEYSGSSRLESIKIFNNQRKETYDQRIDGIFLAIGHVPNTEIFKKQLKLDKKGYIKTKNIVFTSKNGIFSAGDVGNIPYKQAITAAGFGCMAAIEAERYLNSLK